MEFPMTAFVARAFIYFATFAMFCAGVFFTDFIMQLGDQLADLLVGQLGEHVVTLMRQ
jgi:hypothetical protein